VKEGKLNANGVSAGDKRPFFAYVAPKAPHIEDGPGWPMAQPAPWYNQSSLFEGIKAPRTPNWNLSAPDHHWLVRTQVRKRFLFPTVCSY
jgi:hypothetical protein